MEHPIDALLEFQNKYPEAGNDPLLTVLIRAVREDEAKQWREKITELKRRMCPLWEGGDGN